MNKYDKEALERYQQRLDLIKSNAALTLNETKEQQINNIQRAKKDIGYCIERYFGHLATCKSADFHIEFSNKVKKNPNIRAFAQWGRGLAKSIFCDVFIPFWLHINKEANYVVLVGNTYDTAKALLGDIQAEFEANPQIISDFGEQKITGFWTEGFFRTKSGFIGKAQGLGQSVRGLRVGAQRPDLIICDDLEIKRTVKNPQAQDEIVEWIETALLKTMDGSPRRFLYANNRFAPRMIQTVLQEKHPKWYVHHVPAYDKKTHKPVWDSKYDDNYYKELENDDGILSCRAEYLGEPHTIGKIFTDKHLVWRKRPKLSLFTRFVCHWDIAWTDNDTSDYNAMKFMGVVKDGTFGNLYTYCRQVEIEDALVWLANLLKKLPKTILQKTELQYERQFINKEITRTIAKVEKEYNVKFNFIEINTPKIKKYERLLGLYPYYQNKRVWYCDTLKSDNDNNVAFEQLKGIEPGYRTKDDAPDAEMEAIRRLEVYVYSEDEAVTITTGIVESQNTI